MTVHESRFGFHPFDFPTLKKLREINKLYYWREDLIGSDAHKLRKLPHNRFDYSKGKFEKTPWVQKERPEIPYVGDIIEAGRHGKGNPEAVRPIRYSVVEIDVILEEARKNYGK
jgi:hypothetical protein